MTEHARLAALAAFDILDTPPERGFDDIVELARGACETPVALVSFVAADRQWFKARSGFGLCETPVGQSVCAHALKQSGVLVIPDLTLDPRTHDNTLVTGEPHLRFYAGAPLKTSDGQVLGTLCVLDDRPRPAGLNPRQMDALERLARQVMAQLDLRRASAERDAASRVTWDADIRHRQIIDSAVDYGIITMDLQGDVTSWNIGAQNILGWSEAEMRGKPADVFFTPEDVASGIPEAEMAGARESGRGNDERWHVRKDGSRFFALGEMMPLTSNTGDLVGYLKILRDRTQQRATDERLRTADERLQMALEASGVVGLWDWMVDTDLLHGDANFARLYGLDVAKTAAGLTMEEYQRFVVPDDLASLRADIRRTFERGADFLVEYRLEIPGLPLRWVECKGRLIADDTGRAVRFSGTAVDITTRKQANDAVRRSEASARANAERMQLALAAGAIIGTWFWDLLTDRFSVDEAFARSFGLDPTLGREGLSLKQIVETVHPDDQAGLARAIDEAVARGGPYAHQYRTRRRDGHYRWLEANGRVELGDDGTPLRFPGVLIDIEDRRAVEAERDRAFSDLRNLNDTLEQRVAERTAERDRMWETSPDLMLVIDFDGVFRRVNPAWTKLLGYEPDELVGHHVNEFVLPADHDETVDAYELAAAGGSPQIQNRYRHKDGSTRWVSWVAAPAGDMTYATGRDVTAEKDRSAALAVTQEALRQSQKMEAVGQLTGGLAHDFNNLLAGITGALDLMSMRINQGRLKDVDRYMAAAQGAAKRAAALTHRLLAFSRRQTLAPRATDVNALVGGMVDLIQRTVGPSIAIETAAGSDLWSALVDPSQLENALLNLCINARDAMPDGGRITIETSNRTIDALSALRLDMPQGQYLALSVTDTGTGMPAEVIAKAFDPFFTTKPIGQGTGLGLSMIYGFAKQSGGQVRIHSVVGQGTTIWVYLPRHLGEADAPEIGLTTSVSAFARAGETVLVVDDEPTVRLLVTDVLEDLGYLVVEAADSASGLRVLQSDARVDLLVTDVGLPGGMNGRQMADAARLLRPDLKVLFITGYAENVLFNNGHREHELSVLTKPFTVDAFAARVRELVTK